MKKKTVRKSKPKRKPTREPTQLSIYNLKLNRKDRAVLNALAECHAEGNFSAWIRHASLKYLPKKGEKLLVKGYK